MLSLQQLFHSKPCGSCHPWYGLGGCLDFKTDKTWGRGGFVASTILPGIVFASLIIAEKERSYWSYVSKNGLFSEMLESIMPYYLSFFIFGMAIFISLLILAVPKFYAFLQKIKP